jgi:hypothetical protein
MIIKKDHKELENNNTKEIYFRDIVDCYLPKNDIKKSLKKGWPHAIYLQTRDRLYILCMKTIEERNMWISGFRYIIASTTTVQNIIKNNNEKINEKMRLKTKHF